MVPLIDRIEVEGPRTVEVGEQIRFTATAVQPYDPDLPPRFGFVPNEAIRLELRALETAPGYESNVPHLAYMWRSLKPGVLRPVGSPADPSDDPSFDDRTMTIDGTFEAIKPGTARIAIMSGTHQRVVKVRMLP